jgi:ADP-ribose pyrophosphatase YjhB (NUDIX family)
MVVIELLKAETLGKEAMPMNFCSNCGAPVVYRIPEGDDRLRFLCESCGTIHYQNPKMVVGCIPIWEDRILLCLRAIEPRYGKWTLPAGFLENGETATQGAARETLEEAGTRVENLEPYLFFNLPFINQVYLIFRSRLPGPQFTPGAETLEARLFGEHEIPWQDLAFPVIAHTLKRYFQDLPGGRFPFQMGDIPHRGHRVQWK